MFGMLESPSILLLDRPTEVSVAMLCRLSAILFTPAVHKLLQFNKYTFSSFFLLFGKATAMTSAVSTPLLLGEKYKLEGEKLLSATISVYIYHLMQ